LRPGRFLTPLLGQFLPPRDPRFLDSVRRLIQPLRVLPVEFVPEIELGFVHFALRVGHAVGGCVKLTLRHELLCLVDRIVDGRLGIAANDAPLAIDRLDGAACPGPRAAANAVTPGSGTAAGVTGVTVGGAGLGVTGAGVGAGATAVGAGAGVSATGGTAGCTACAASNRSIVAM
jgi:hypothetical protein